MSRRTCPLLVAAGCLLVLLAGLLSATPAAAEADTRLGRDAARVRGECAGGGRLAVAVRPLTGDDTYPVEVTVRGVAAGSTWRGELVARSYDFYQGRRFRFADVVVEQGSWTLRFETRRYLRYTGFDVRTRSDDGRRCSTVFHPSGQRALAYTSCPELPVQGLLIRRRDNGRLAVHANLGPVPPDERGRWTLEFRLRGGGRTEAVTQRRETDEDGVIRSGFVRRGFTHPVGALTATSPSGLDCTTTVNGRPTA